MAGVNFDQNEEMWVILASELDHKIFSALAIFDFAFISFWYAYLSDMIEV